MLPLIYPDDIVYLKRINFKPINIYDIILVKKGTRAFIHRVIYKNLHYLVTKGDNNLISDGKIISNQVIGKIDQIKRGKQIFKPEDIYLWQSTQYFQEIIELKKALEKMHIDFVFLKGLPLNLYFEKSHPKRVYSDCDVLINKYDWQKAEIILNKLGYKKSKTSYSKIHEILKDKITELSYLKYINNLPVIFDIHLEAGFIMNQLGKLDTLYSQSLIDDITRQFLKEKQVVKIQKKLFPILSPSDLIIYLSLHFFHHNYRGIHMLNFLNEVINRCSNTSKKESLWGKMLDKIKRYDLQNFIYPSFFLLNRYYPSRVPKYIIDSIKPNNKIIEYINENIIHNNIFNDEQKMNAGIARFKNLFFLSPYPILIRLLSVFNPQVIYSGFWVITLFTKRSLIKAFKSS